MIEFGNPLFAGYISTLSLFLPSLAAAAIKITPLSSARLIASSNGAAVERGTAAPQEAEMICAPFSTA
ncbi:hypothetical protein D3C72_1806140 [compost metagenome]